MMLCLQADDESETHYYRFLHDRILDQLKEQDEREEKRYE